jgi:putative hydroxymethylpyrimidine transport system permease protein
MIIIVLISLLVAWELLVSALNVAPYILPAPSELFVAMWEARSLWPKHIWMTLSEALIGLVISVVLAVGLSVTMLRSITAHKVLYPLLIISQTIPLIAISPIFIIWFDYTIWSKVAVAILWSFFPIVISLNEGFRNVSLERREMMISLGANVSLFGVAISTSLIFCWSTNGCRLFRDWCYGRRMVRSGKWTRFFCS